MKNVLKVLTVLTLLTAVPVLAQTPEVSTLPVTEPLDVGGTILQPGTYLIRVVAPRADRNKVQITSLDRQTIYATVLTVPHELEPNEEVPNSTFLYFPAGEGQPRALRTWFASDPASGGGHDIVYEESRARQLARLANQSVVTSRGEEYAVIAPDATVQPYVAPQTTTTTQTTQTQTRVETETRTSTPMTSATETTIARNETVEMPATASRVPLLALLGLLAIAAAGIVRFVRHA